jgi:subtilisin family serine protease
MGMTTAWQQTVGGNVTVAVIDSGIDLDHPDLAANLWTNPGEIPGNGADDDGNGYVDDVHGYDFIGRDADPGDPNGHGTHVAGIVGARGDNRIGGSGVAQHVKLMAVRVLDANASGTTDGVAEGLIYAVNNGAKIVNLSLAGPSGSDSLLAAMLYAEVRGVVVVAAAGNESRDLAVAPSFPASYIVDNIIGVSATSESLKLADISNYGVGADIAAPGEDILSTANDGGYEWRTGTSMAAPAVAGTLALIASVRPDLDAAGLRSALYAGATRSGLPVSVGSVNAAGALRQAIPADTWKSAPVTSSPAKKVAAAKNVALPSSKTKTSAKKTTKKKACRKPGKKAGKKAKARYKKCVRKAKAAKAKAAKAKAAKARAAKAKLAKS